MGACELARLVHAEHHGSLGRRCIGNVSPGQLRLIRRQLASDLAPQGLYIGPAGREHPLGTGFASAEHPKQQVARLNLRRSQPRR